MLKRSQGQTITPHQLHDGEEAELGRDLTISYDEVIGIVRRQGWIVAVVCALSAILGLTFALTTTPRYTATAKVIIDNPSSQLASISPFGDLGTDNATILSQVELIRSEKLSGMIVDRFGLAAADTPDIKDQGVIGNFMNWIGRALLFESAKSGMATELEGDPLAARKSAIRRTSKALDVKRMGMTYILDISYTDPNPARAAQIANGFAEAYLDEQLALKIESANQARDWLRGRIDELSREAQIADMDLQKFRTKNAMVTVDGRRVDEQQLSELNSRLVAAMDATSQAEAKFQRIESIIASGDVRSLVTEALGSNIITDLRQKYLAVDKQALELEALVGSGHTRVSALREEMKRYEAQIFEELQRIRESARSELSIAREAQADLQIQVKGLTTVSAGNNEVLVEQKALEDRANTARTMLLTLLQRDQEAQQGQSFSMTEARIVSPASTPNVPSYPNKMLFVLAATLLGAVGGAGLGYLREIADRSFRHSRQVEKLLNLPLISAVPLLKDGKASRKTGKTKLVRSGAASRELPDTAEGADVRLVDYAVSAPMSGFAEALRAIKLSVDLSAPEKGGCVVGIVSAQPGEGKSTLSKNFASLMALSGFRTILIDGDLRAHGITRYIDRDNEAGLVEVLEGRYGFGDVLRTEDSSGLDVLMSVVDRRVYNSSELLGSKPMKALLDRFRAEYDYVIVDLPPLGPVIDANAFAQRVDIFIMVVEWGVTPRHSVRTLLASQQQVYERCAGIVFNKVDPQTIHRYDYYGSNYYGYGRYNYEKGYHNYYVEERREKSRDRKPGIARWLSGNRGMVGRRRSKSTPSRGDVVIGRQSERTSEGIGGPGKN